MKTITIIPNNAPSLHVVEFVKGALDGAKLFLAPIVAWKVTTEDNPDGGDRPLVYADPVTFDPEADVQPTIVDCERWLWWPYDGGGGIGRESLIAHLNPTA